MNDMIIYETSPILYHLYQTNWTYVGEKAYDMLTPFKFNNEFIYKVSKPGQKLLDFGEKVFVKSPELLSKSIDTLESIIDNLPLILSGGALIALLAIIK